MADLMPWPAMLLITVAAFTALFVARRTFYRYVPRNLQIADILAPFVLLNIHMLSFQIFGWSFVPYLLIAWLLLAIAYVIFRGFWQQNFTYRSYLVAYWRMSDIFFPVVYLILLIFGLILG